MGETEYMVRSSGYIQSIRDLEVIPVSVDKNGTPIRLKDVANIIIGPELRRGLVDLDGTGEVVGGVIIMRYGENALATIQSVRDKLAELQKGLPEGVEIVPVYDRGDLIAAYPVSPKKTSWKVDVENIGTGYAMCAIDALGMAFTFGKKTTIETMDQTTKQPLIIIMNPDSEKEWTEFKDYYVSYKKFANINETTCNAALNQCPFIHIHSSLSSVPQDPSIEVLTFMDALERAKSRFSPEGMLQQMMEKESKETTDTATKTESED